ncbi:uncharacterized protein LOC129600773 [Paramacrobiotus metropolitanus]|uniref:uncharacterized protein LOC129600773 n=1 Tax=Paramacrobiotus metropolitanus TaxID=2943436 RepID=UPI0024465130|nr:uncharacterized protein LOC129600773 [Paramacrobiotus metropolitanus]
MPSTDRSSGMSRWMRALTLVAAETGRELVYGTEMRKMLCATQSADPRLASQHRGRKWCLDGPEDIPFDTLSRITLRFLSQMEGDCTTRYFIKIIEERLFPQYEYGLEYDYCGSDSDDWLKMAKFQMSSKMYDQAQQRMRLHDRLGQAGVLWQYPCNGMCAASCPMIPAAETKMRIYTF